jgi:hypothetical protein
MIRQIIDLGILFNASGDGVGTPQRLVAAAYVAGRRSTPEATIRSC